MRWINILRKFQNFEYQKLFFIFDSILFIKTRFPVGVEPIYQLRKYSFWILIEWETQKMGNSEVPDTPKAKKKNENTLCAMGEKWKISCFMNTKLGFKYFE